MGLVRFLRRVVLRQKRASGDRIAAVDFEDAPHPKLSWDDVRKLSMDFSRVIGYGGFSTVYLAHFSGAVAAVKRYSGGQRLYRVFTQESEIMQRLHHRNIVKLLAYCDDRDEGVLVLEYISNGNLQEKLHPRLDSTSLPWKRRMVIAFQLAQAVSYLHDTCTPHIIHGDIKPSNILLDSNLDCKLCDFGSAKTVFLPSTPHPEFPKLSRSNQKLMTGSPGYTDPVYIKTGIVSKKNDIYSMGVVILELITGIEGVGPSGERLTDRVQEMLKDATKVGEMVDRRLNGEVDLEEARVMVEVAARCLCGSTGARPSAADVVAVMRSEVSGSLSFLLEEGSL